MLKGNSMRLVLLFAITASAILLAGCEQKSINEIKADPSRYASREVAVVGNVVQSYSVLGNGFYEVDDGTGRLWIVSHSGVPRKGARVVVKGTVRDTVNLGTMMKLPEAVGSGLVLMENSHRAK